MVRDEFVGYGATSDRVCDVLIDDFEGAILGDVCIEIGFCLDW